VSKLRAHILCIKNRDIKPCSKHYSEEDLLLICVSQVNESFFILQVV